MTQKGKEETHNSIVHAQAVGPRTALPHPRVRHRRRPHPPDRADGHAHAALADAVLGAQARCDRAGAVTDAVQAEGGAHSDAERDSGAGAGPVCI